MPAATGELLRLRLRRDRVTLVLWVVGLAGLWAISASAIGTSFDENGRRQLVALLVSNPALLVLRGAPTGVGVGAVMSAAVFNWVALLTAVMATTLAVRHSRGDEETGRAEMVGATVTGRLAPVTATMLTAAIEVGVLAAAFSGLSIAAGLDAQGSLLTAAGLLGIGLTFAGVGLLAAQAAPTARAANGAAAVVAGVAFMVRGLGDANGSVSDDATRVTSGPLSWASPIGWMTHVRAFADPPWQPEPVVLLLYVAAVAVLAAVVLAIERRRELGASLVGERAGPPIGRRGLGTPLGLAIRLQRGTAIGWAVVAAVLGGVVGGLAPSISETLAGDDTIRQILESLGAQVTADMVTLFLLAVAGIVAILACAATMQAVVRVRHEELSRGEAVLTTATGRTRWAGSWIVVAGMSGLLVLATFTLAAGVALAAVDDVQRWPEVLRVGASMLPAVVVYLAVGVLLLGLLPRATGVLGWLLLLVPTLAGEFAPLLGPGLDWVANISPFQWLPDPLSDAPDLLPTLVMVTVSAIGIGVGLAALRRRDVTV